MIAAATASWVIFYKWTVYYQLTLFGSGRQRQQNYGKSWFGLYLIHFNGGTKILPWYARVSTVCADTQEMVNLSATNAIIPIWNNVCGVNCLGHFKTRCSAYKQTALISYVVMAGLVGGSCLSMVACAWLFTFGKSRQFLQVREY